jgi:hypothetical protein
MERLDPATLSDAGATAATPHVFVRTFSVPPGLPWTQARAAQMEARHGAPLPMPELMLRLRRLAAWSPSQPARYAALYLRREDYRAPFETTVAVDGEALSVAFGVRRLTDFGQLQFVGLIALAIFMSALVGTVLVSVSLSQRSETEAALSGLENRVQGKLGQAQRRASQQGRDADLIQAHRGSVAPGEALTDLAWVARNRTPDARIVAVHWDHGALAIEARGTAAPVAASDRTIVRAKHPLRDGVSLWGVAPSTSAAAGVSEAK